MAAQDAVLKGPVFFHRGAGLRFEAASLSATFRARLRGVVRRTDGQIRSFGHTLPAVAVGGIARASFGVPEGELVGFVIDQETGLSVLGQSVARLTLLQQPSPVADTVGVLGFGVIDHNANVGWPASFGPTGQWPEVVVEIAFAAPGLGNDLSVGTGLFLPTSFEGAVLQLITSAAAASRAAEFGWDDGGGTLRTVWASQTAQAASLTREYVLGKFGYQPTALGTRIYVPVPEHGWLRDRFFISVTGNLQAGDAWQAGQINVRGRMTLGDT